MLTEDAEQFENLFMSVARTMRVKVSAQDSFAYFEALRPLSFAVVRERLLTWRDENRFFPKVSELLNEAPSDVGSVVEPYSPPWWEGVRKVEGEIARRHRLRPLTHIADDPELRAAEAEVSRMARGCALHHHTSEGEDWVRAFDVASLNLRRLQFARAGAELAASPAPPADDVKAIELRAKTLSALADDVARIEITLRDRRAHDEEGSQW